MPLWLAEFFLILLSEPAAMVELLSKFLDLLSTLALNFRPPDVY